MKQFFLVILICMCLTNLARAIEWHTVLSGHEIANENSKLFELGDVQWERGTIRLRLQNVAPMIAWDYESISDYAFEADLEWQEDSGAMESGIIFNVTNDKSFYSLSGYLAGSLWKYGESPQPKLLSKVAPEHVHIMNSANRHTFRVEVLSGQIVAFIDNTRVMQTPLEDAQVCGVGVRAFNPSNVDFSNLKIQIPQKDVWLYELSKKVRVRTTDQSPAVPTTYRPQATQVYLFKDKKYYSDDEFSLIEMIEEKLKAAQQPYKTMNDHDAAEMMKTASTQQPMILVCEAGQRALPNVFLDPDCDADILEHSYPETFSYLGISLQRSPDWWQGPYPRSMMYDLMFHNGWGFFLIGNRYPDSIVYPGREIRKMEGSSEDIDHAFTALQDRSRWGLKHEAFLGGTGLSMPGLDKANFDFYGLTYLTLEQGRWIEKSGEIKTFLSNVDIRVGLGHLHYFEMPDTKSDAAERAVKTVGERPWDRQVWPSKVLSAQSSLGLDYPAVGRNDHHSIKFVFGDVSNFGECCLYDTSDRDNVIEYLESTQSAVSYTEGKTNKNVVIDLVPNGNFRLCYSRNLPHMNGEEDLQQWGKCFTDVGTSPTLRGIQYDFAFADYALVRVMELENIGKDEIKNVAFTHSMVPRLTNRYTVSGNALNVILRGEAAAPLNLLLYPTTGNLFSIDIQSFVSEEKDNQYSLNDLMDGKIAENFSGQIKLHYSGHSLAPGQKVAFAWVVGVGRDGNAVERTVLAAQRWILGVVPSVNQNGMAYWDSKNMGWSEFIDWKWIYAPKTHSFDVFYRVGDIWTKAQQHALEAMPNEIQSADACLIRYNNSGIKNGVEIQRKPLPKTEQGPCALNDLDKADAIVMLAPGVNLNTIEQIYEKVAKKTGIGLNGTGDFTLEFCHHWIPESPTVAPLYYWTELLGDERYHLLANNLILGNIAKNQMGANGFVFRRSELYGLAYDFCPGGTMGLLNAAICMEWNHGREDYENSRQLAEQIASFLIHAYPFRANGDVKFYEWPESFLLHREGMLVRAEDIALYCTGMLELWKSTGNNTYKDYAQSGLNFLMKYSQRPEHGNGFCAVRYNPQSPQSSAIDNWFGPHTTFPVLDALYLAAVYTKDARYLQSASKAIDGWISDELVQDDGLLTFREDYHAHMVMAMARLMIQFGYLAGRSDWLEKGVCIAQNEFVIKKNKGIFENDKNLWKYPEYNFQIPYQMTFPLICGDKNKGNKTVAFEVIDHDPEKTSITWNNPIGDSMVWLKKSVEPISSVELDGKAVPLAQSINGLGDMECGWYTTDRYIVLRFGKAGKKIMQLNFIHNEIAAE